MTELRETDIGGIRCFWVATDRPTLAAMLLFRQGMADEPIGEAGWQHLLEHLALARRKHGGAQLNGHVSLLQTGFQAHGPPEDVVAFLNELTAWLAAPVLDGLTGEARVLSAEQHARGSSPAMSALTMRYGTSGPGVGGYGEPGLGRATPEALAERAARVFTRDNAVLILDGPPPAGLALDLPPGELLPIARAVPCEDKLPAAYVSDTGLVLSGIVPRSPVMPLGHDLLRMRLSDRLRDQEGAAYAPWSSYEPVDADRAALLGGSDVHPQGLASVGDLVLMLARGLAGAPPDEQEVRDLAAARVRDLVDPYARVGVAVRAAHEHLLGRPPVTLDEMVAEVEAVTPDQIQDGWRAFNSTLLLGVPGRATWADQLPMLSFPITAPTGHGNDYRSVDWPANRTRLAVATTGVELHTGGAAKRVPMKRVAAMLTYDDGSRYVLRDDGYGLMVRAQDWRGGTKAIARLDQVVPSELHLPQPAGGFSGERVRASVGRRWFSWAAAFARPLRRGFDLFAALILLTVLLGVGLAVFCVVGDAAEQLIPTILLTVGLVRLLIWWQDDSARPR